MAGIARKLSPAKGSRIVEVRIAFLSTQDLLSRKCFDYNQFRIVRYNPARDMQPEKWANLLRDWHDDLIWWARHGVPRLLVIFLLAFFLIRILGMITRRVVDLSKKGSTPNLRAQQVRTLAGAIHSVGVFIVVFIALL